MLKSNYITFFVAIALTASTFVSCGKQPEQTKTTIPHDATTLITNVTTDYDLIDDNHVGNDWDTYCSIQGVPWTGGTTYEISVGDQITIQTKITENDSSDDVGRDTVTKTVTKENLHNGFFIIHSVTVREDKGRYAGNTATWKVTHTFKPVK